MSCPDDRKAVRLAYQTLLKLNITRLPVDVLWICKQLKNSRVMTFRQAEKELAAYSFLLPEYGPSECAFTIRDDACAGNPRFLLLYNDDMHQVSAARMRFSLAHELGHIVMKHTDKDEGHEAEQAANTYAQHLLCPEPLADALRGDSISEWLWSLTFGISHTTAKIVMDGRYRASYVGQAEKAALTAAFGVDDYGSSVLLQGAFEKILAVNGL